MSGNDLARLAAGQQAALLRYAYLLTGSQADAEDLVQRTYEKLLRTSKRHVTFPLAYARKALFREYCSTRTRLRLAPMSSGAGESMPSFEDDVVLRIWIWNEILGLSPRQRATLVLRYYEDLPDDEIAAALGCRRATVRSLASRGIEQLRQRYSLMAGANQATQNGEDVHR